MNATGDANTDMADVARYAPIRVFLVGVGRLMFGGILLAVGVLVFFISFTEHYTPAADGSTRELDPTILIVGAVITLVSLLILPGAIGRMVSAFSRRFYFRAGVSGIEICMPVRRWWGSYRPGIWHFRWEEIAKLVHFTSKINGIPTSTELRIQLTDGKRLRVERYVFSQSVGTIQHLLLQDRERWEASVKAEAERRKSENRHRDAQAKLVLAREHEAIGNIAAAVAAAEEAVRLDPENPTLRNWLSSFLFAQGRLRESAQALESAVALAPDRALYHSELGNVLLHEGRLVGAASALRRAIELDPQDPHAHHCLGIALARSGDLAAARAELATLETLDPARAERLRAELPPA